MADIFISYAREDRDKAAAIADTLSAYGWDVWWDPRIPAGRQFDDVIEEALAEALCVIVLWSETSAKSRWVRTEAGEALERKVLVPVMIEPVKIPLAFRRIQSADLSAWAGDRKAPEMRQLVRDIARISPLLATKAKDARARRKAKRQAEEAEADAKRKAEEADAKREAEEAAAKREAEEAAAKREAEEAAAEREAEEAAAEREAEEAAAKREAEEIAAEREAEEIAAKRKAEEAAAKRKAAAAREAEEAARSRAEPEAPPGSKRNIIAKFAISALIVAAVLGAWFAYERQQERVYQQLMDQARVALDGKRFADARAHLREAVRLKPNDGSIARLSDRIDQAEKAQRKPPVTAVPKEEPEPRAVIEKLLRQASRAFREKRLLRPADDNAMLHYRAVLELDPQNSTARQGVADIRNRLIAAVGELIERKQFEEAGRALEEAKAFISAPDHHAAVVRLEDAMAAHAPVAGSAFSDELKDGSRGPRMIVIPAGGFDMGSPATEPGHYKDEAPLHRVTISKPIAMGVNEITVGEFGRFVAATGYRTDAERSGGCDFYDGDPDWTRRPDTYWKQPGFDQGKDHPVVCVSWNDADNYVRWLARETGRAYRLPSESEWEYAARAGSASARYWSEPAESCGYANVGDLSLQSDPRFRSAEVHNCNDNRRYTSAVSSYDPNGFGLHDALGNVWEWTADCAASSYTGKPTDGSARSDGDCAKGVFRGGSWIDWPELVRLANRGIRDRDFRNTTIGLRVARDLP